MITRVSSLNVDSNAKDPRRKSQSTHLRQSLVIPYKSAGKDREMQVGHDHFSKQKSNALVTSASIVAGSALFTVCYFLVSALSMNLKNNLMTRI